MSPAPLSVPSRPQPTTRDLWEAPPGAPGPHAWRAERGAGLYHTGAGAAAADLRDLPECARTADAIGLDRVAHAMRKNRPRVPQATSACKGTDLGLVVVTEHFSSLSPWYPGHEGPVSVLSPPLSHLMREDWDAGEDLRAVPALGTTRQKAWYRT